MTKKRTTKDEMKQLVEAALRNHEGMSQSQVCLSIFTENYEKDPIALMQFALAILLDKPIYLLVPEGRLVPANVRAVAAGLAYYDPKSLESKKAATVRLLTAAKGM